MKNLKKIFFCITILLFLSEKTSAVIKDSLFATVGDKAITQSDIINEIKLTLILTGTKFSENKKKQLEAMAIKSTIKRNIKQIEIEKYNNLKFSQEDVDNELKNIINRLNVDKKILGNILENNGLSLLYIINNIKTELLWNSLIFELYKNRLSINVNEIEDQLKIIVNKKEIEEFLLSEIVINVVTQDKLVDKIKEVKDAINKDGFENVAMNLSISDSSMNGGDIGWVSENVMTDEFKSEIFKTPIGHISKAILLPNGILFFKVKDKRKVKSFNSLEEEKNRLVDAEKNKILNMHSLSHYDNLKKSIPIKYY